MRPLAHDCGLCGSQHTVVSARLRVTGCWHAATVVGARGRYLMRLWSVVRGRPTCGRCLMRLSHKHDRPSARLTVGSVADTADLCAHVA
ncbi:hypothetical protein GW17_00026236 [Ensete ventricosum]|nr:hypothetical protein GW17_00026236 [Ensete ventricosum]RZR95487.1 hypothetical protein BHM03_00024342 [Ensete ventricosum]